MSEDVVPELMRTCEVSSDQRAKCGQVNPRPRHPVVHAFHIYVVEADRDFESVTQAVNANRTLEICTSFGPRIYRRVHALRNKASLIVGWLAGTPVSNHYAGPLLSESAPRIEANSRSNRSKSSGLNLLSSRAAS